MHLFGLWQLGDVFIQIKFRIQTFIGCQCKQPELPVPKQQTDTGYCKSISCFFYVNMECLTWVRMNSIGVDGLRCGLAIGLRWEGTESIDPNRGGYAGDGCGRNAWRCAGACK